MMSIPGAIAFPINPPSLGQPFVFGKTIRVQKADGNCLYPGRDQLAGYLAHRLLVQGSYDLPAGADPLRYGQPPTAWHRWVVLLRDLLTNSVIQGSLVASNVNDVAHAVAGDKAGSGSFALQ